jgi:hypothetical protein
MGGDFNRQHLAWEGDMELNRRIIQHNSRNLSRTRHSQRSLYAGSFLATQEDLSRLRPLERLFRTVNARETTSTELLPEHSSIRARQNCLYNPVALAHQYVEGI